MGEQLIRDSEIKGKPAEEWFIEHHNQFFTTPVDQVEDLRRNHVEGEFQVTLADEQRLLIEVKSDYGNALKWKNVQVEMENHGGQGWFKWCIRNGVTNICWLLYQQDACTPLLAIWVDFSELKQQIDSRPLDDWNYTRDGTCIRLPMAEINAYCPSTIWHKVKEGD